MARRILCAVAVVCAACSEKQAPGDTEESSKLARLVIKQTEQQRSDEGQLARKEAPKKSTLAASAGDANKVLGAPLGGLGLRGTGAGGAGVGVLGGIGTKGRGGSGVAQGFGGLGLSGSGAGGYDKLRGRAVVHGAFSKAADRETRAPDGVGAFQSAGVNPFTSPAEDRLSTFAADVDTASYTLARRVILEGRLPPEDSVRVEEFVNYFRYRYPEPAGAPLGVSMELAPSPFTAGHHLLRVGVQGKRLELSERKVSHLTFLVDVSGSMQAPDRLPLAKRTLRMLVDQLNDGDTVALVTYANGVKVVLPHTGLQKKAQIHAAIEDLVAGGGTGMASGIELAYAQAAKVLDDRSSSRVIILSDGDANIGPRNPEALLSMIRGKVKEGVTVTTLGFGLGNYRDDLMEKFANAGNGNNHYIDSAFQARRVLVEQLGSTLEVIAQDVKLQVEFDPAQVKQYRLVGYENRDVADRDFRDDKVDGGELGSGHSVTAVYELELAGAFGAGLATVRVRAKRPRGVEAQEWAHPLPADAIRADFASASSDFRFATAVVGAAELFRRSPHARAWKLGAVLRIARGAAGESAERREFVDLLELAESRAILASR